MRTGFMMAALAVLGVAAAHSAISPASAEPRLSKHVQVDCRDAQRRQEAALDSMDRVGGRMGRIERDHDALWARLEREGSVERLLAERSRLERWANEYDGYYQEYAGLAQTVSQMTRYMNQLDYCPHRQVLSLHFSDELTRMGTRRMEFNNIVANLAAYSGQN